MDINCNRSTYVLVECSHSTRFMEIESLTDKSVIYWQLSKIFLMFCKRIDSVEHERHLLDNILVIQKKKTRSDPKVNTN